ncbi:MAG TPA: multicopper oxidase family protein [Candidatus Acidoferrum sp.]|nr:multicopper oxidase family protein [Candidatus Acidoferrum sp.]
MRPARRSVMLGAGLAIGGGLAGLPLGRAAAPDERQIVAAPRSYRLTGDPSVVTAGWGYADAFPPPTLRVKRGETLRVRLVNRLPEHTSIHWHGIRLPNAMDGVPYLTQAPVEPGADFLYEFSPPDAGTFWFHPHCNSIEQMGRGLTGALVVENLDDPPFDADIVCLYRDWHVDERGNFTAFSTDEGAGRAGTMGSLHSVNGVTQPAIGLPAGGLVRLRILNLDNARIVTLAMPNQAAAVIAIDGNPVAPAAFGEWQMGPAMRLDLALRAPAREGATFALMNNFAAEPWVLATFRTIGPAKSAATADVPALQASPIPRPNLDHAETLQFTFSAASATALDPNDLPPALTDLQSAIGADVPAADLLCRSQRIFWAINKRPWPGQAGGHVPPPLATLRRGRSYIFELINATPHTHPIHLHGHTFLVIESNKRTVTPYHTDTVLIHTKERVKIAFVADNPGDWMLHCHIIEHQDTGMMGYVRVA